MQDSRAIQPNQTSFCRAFWLLEAKECVSLFYVIDTGSIGSRARIEMGVTYLPKVEQRRYILFSPRTKY